MPNFLQFTNFISINFIKIPSSTSSFSCDLDQNQKHNSDPMASPVL